MSDSVTAEIVWYTPSEDYLDSPLTLLRVMGDEVYVDSGGTTTPGWMGAFCGFQVADHPEAVWATVWESLKHHQDFLQTESYGDQTMNLVDAMDGTGQIMHVRFADADAFFEAASAPITEFLYITLKQRHGHTRGDSLPSLVEEMKAELQQTNSCYASSWGPSVEMEDIYVGVIGWESEDDYRREYHGSLGAVFSRIREIGTVDRRYARLSSTEDVSDQE